MMARVCVSTGCWVDVHAQVNDQAGARLTLRKAFRTMAAEGEPPSRPPNYIDRSCITIKYPAVLSL